MKPILIQWNDFILYSYPLFIGMAWGLSYRFSEYLLSLNNPDSLKKMKVFFLGAFLFAWLGAKATFLFVSSKENFNEYLLSSNFWLGGGFVFYGGLIGGCFFSYINSKFFKGLGLNDIYSLLPTLAFAHALGRVGCFLAGCCFGTHFTGAWSVHMHGASRHPVQLYESFLLLVLGIILLKIWKSLLAKVNILRTYILGYSLIRFTLEFFRGDKVRGIYFFDLSTSQIIALGLAGLILVEVLTKKVFKKN